MIRRILKRLAKKIRQPAVAPQPPPPETVLPEEEEPLPDIEVHVEGLLLWQKENHEFQFIDIREVYEMRQGYIPNSWLIPMNQIPDKISHLPKDKTLVLYCAAGMRSFDVTYYLRKNGFTDVWSLSEGGAGFAPHGWIFPEDGQLQLCQSIVFREKAIKNRQLTNKYGTIQHIAKQNNQLLYTIGQFENENIHFIQEVDPIEIKPV